MAVHHSTTSAHLSSRDCHMPASEIDDIFSSKPKGKAKAALLPAPTIPSTEPSKKSKKKKNDAKRKREADDEANSQSAKRRLPETVLDPSVHPQPTASKVVPPKSIRAAKLQKLAVGGATTNKSKKQEEELFKDSRGTGPRTHNPSFSCFYTNVLPTGRKTEEGFAIYKEDELGISDTGGSKRSFTAAPNRQNCSHCLQTHRYARSTVNAVSRECVIQPNRL